MGKEGGREGGMEGCSSPHAPSYQLCIIIIGGREGGSYIWGGREEVVQCSIHKLGIIFNCFNLNPNRIIMEANTRSIAEQ